MSTGEYYCVQEDEIPTEVISDKVTTIKDSTAQLTIKFEDDSFSTDYFWVRIKNLESDSTQYRELPKTRKMDFTLEEGIYQLDLRMDVSMKFTIEELNLKAFENRSLTISVGKPSQFVTIQKTRRKRKSKDRTD